MGLTTTQKEIRRKDKTGDESKNQGEINSIFGDRK